MTAHSYFSIPRLLLLHRFYGHPTALPVPVHDPPVAWRVKAFDTFPLVACPAIGGGACMIGQAPRDLPILDSEPGQRP